MIRSLSRDGLLFRVNLGPLSLGEVKKFLSASLGYWEIPERIINFINEVTQGNPLFLVEVLKILVEKGYIYKTGNAWSFIQNKEIDIPLRISDILREKIETLTPDARDLLMTASVLGEVFTLMDLKFITGENEGYLVDLLDEGLKKGIILEGSGNVGEYRFLYRMMQKVFYNTLSSGRRSFIHRKISEMLEAQKENEENLLEKLAYHFRNAGLKGKAIQYYIKCAKKSENVMAYDKAIEYYKQSLDLTKQMNVDKKLVFDIYYTLGSLDIKIGKFSKAEELFLDALKITGLEKKDELKLLHKIGYIYSRRGELEKSLEYYRKANSVLPDDSSLEKLSLDIDEAEIYLKKGEYTKSYKLAEDVLRKLGEECMKEKSMVFSLLGDINYFQGNLDNAVKFYNKSLDLARKCSDEARIAIAHRNIGKVLIEQGKKNEAEKFFLTALNVAEKINDKYLIGKLYNNIGFIFSTKDVEKAKEYYMKSLEVTKLIGDEDGLASIFSNIGHLYLRGGEINKALNMFEEALRIWQLIGMVSSIARTYLDVGRVYFYRKNFEKSFYYFFKAKEISQNTDFVNGELSAILHLCELLLEEGKKGAVYELLKEAEKLNVTYKSLNYEVGIKLIKAELAYESGSKEEAGVYYNDIIEKFSEISSKELEVKVDIFSSKFLLSKGKFNESLRYLQRAFVVSDEMGDKFSQILVMFYKAIVFREMGNLNESMTLLNEAQNILSNTPVRLLKDKVDILTKEINRRNVNEDIF